MFPLRPRLKEGGCCRAESVPLSASRPSGRLQEVLRCLQRRRRTCLQMFTNLQHKLRFKTIPEFLYLWFSANVFLQVNAVSIWFWDLLKAKSLYDSRCFCWCWDESRFSLNTSRIQIRMLVWVLFVSALCLPPLSAGVHLLASSSSPSSSSLFLAP